MKNFLWMIIGLTTLLLIPWQGMAVETSLIENETDRINYSVGYQIGGDFKKQGVTLNRETLIKGLEDALIENRSPLMSSQEMRTTLIELKKRIDADQDRKKAEFAKITSDEEREFLAVNAKKERVVTLPNGLQYKVMTSGSGRSPTLEDTVTVNYRGTLIDGREFDSSYREGKPATIPLNSVIDGWKTAIPLMKEGSKWQLFIPPVLAFGKRGPLAERTVIYELELLAIEAPGKTANSSPSTPQKAAPKATP